MDLNTYQVKALAFDAHKRQGGKQGTLLLGLMSEVGELTALTYKRQRKIGKDLPSRDERLRDEAGDVLWYLAALVAENGWTLEEVAAYNLEKLSARREAGTLTDMTR